MKRLFLSGLLLATSSSLVQAQDCKKVKTEVDKFSKTETKTASVVFGKIKAFSMKPSTRWQLSFSQVEGKTKIEAGIAALGEFNQVLDETTYFYFLLDNGNVVKLANKGSVKPVTQAITGGNAVTVFTTYLLNLEPTAEELRTLAGGAVTDVKVEIPSQKIQAPEVSEKDARDFRAIVSCLQGTAK